MTHEEWQVATRGPLDTYSDENKPNAELNRHLLTLAHESLGDYNKWKHQTKEGVKSPTYAEACEYVAKYMLG